MNARLQQFLTMENLTPARFADIMGIQRSGISHLLSGRNNPSFEFIQKMMTAFPKLNSEWLILGKGKPYKENSSMTLEENLPEIKEFNLFSQYEEKSEIKPKEPEIKEDKPIIPAPELHENRIIDTHCMSTNKKTVSRITIFYSDGTFEER